MIILCDRAKIQIWGVAVFEALNIGYTKYSKKSSLYWKEGLTKLKNQDIRDEVKDAGLKLWQIAEELRIADYNLSRKLRHELTGEEKTRIRGIIERLREENGCEV